MYARPSKRQRRIKPIARIGAVDVTVRYDIVGHQKQRAAGKCSDECFDVMEGELLFHREESNFYRDNSLHVMSCLNGTTKKDKLKFAGVAVTGFSPRTDVYEQGFVTQISGLCSVFNNSDGYFPAGETVSVEFSNGNGNNNTNGVPYRKKLVKLVKGDSNPIGICVKGGANKSTIDIILHRSGNQNKLTVPPAPASASSTTGGVGDNIPGSSFKPSRSKKSKSSK